LRLRHRPPATVNGACHEASHSPSRDTDRHPIADGDRLPAEDSHAYSRNARVIGRDEHGHSRPDCNAHPFSLTVTPHRHRDGDTDANACRTISAGTLVAGGWGAGIRL
jgi:hypothetical protein